MIDEIHNTRNDKIRKSLLAFYEKHQDHKCKPFKTYKCKQCGQEFTMNDNRDTNSRIYCSIKCKTEWVKNNVYNKSGGYRKGSGRSKHGWYKGYYCDSTYELVYLIYCLDHNIDIKRSTDVFEYSVDGVTHQYHPDFEVNGKLIEIKGYHTNLVDIKLSSVNKPIKILYRKDLEHCFEYVLKQYGKHRDHLSELYDDYKPMYKYICEYCKTSFTKDKLLTTPTKFCCRSCAGKYRKMINSAHSNIG